MLNLLIKWCIPSYVHIKIFYKILNKIKILINSSWPGKSMPRCERLAWSNKWVISVSSVSSNWAIQPGDCKSKLPLSCACFIHHSWISTKLSRDWSERVGKLLGGKMVLTLGGFVQDVKASFTVCRKIHVIARSKEIM